MYVEQVNLKWWWAGQSSLTLDVTLSVAQWNRDLKTVGIWNLEIWNPETFEIQTFGRLDFKWFGFKWSGYSYAYSYSPNHSKTGPFEIRTFLSRFQMVFDKMAALCQDFRSRLSENRTKWQPFCQPLENRTPLEHRTDHSHSNFECVRYSSPTVYLRIAIVSHFIFHCIYVKTFQTDHWRPKSDPHHK